MACTFSRTANQLSKDQVMRAINIISLFWAMTLIAQVNHLGAQNPEPLPGTLAARFSTSKFVSVSMAGTNHLGFNVQIMSEADFNASIAKQTDSKNSQQQFSEKAKRLQGRLDELDREDASVSSLERSQHQNAIREVQKELTSLRRPDYVSPAALYTINSVQLDYLELTPADDPEGLVLIPFQQIARVTLRKPASK